MDGETRLKLTQELVRANKNKAFLREVEHRAGATLKEMLADIEDGVYYDERARRTAARLRRILGQEDARPA